MEQMGKPCLGACGEELSLENFSAHKATTDGKRTRCKQCISGEEKLRRERLQARVLVVDEKALKVCTACGKEKTLAEFRNRSDSPDGRRGQCSKCFAQKKHNDYQRNKVKYDEYKQRHRQDNKELYAQKERQYYLNNKEKINKRNRAYHQQNKVHLLELNKEWHKQNPNWRKKYRANNPDLCRDRDAIQRAKRYNAYVEPVNRWVLFEVYKGCCGICGKVVERDSFEVDHIIPLSKGGLHMYTNTQISCRHCNAVKNDKIIDPSELAVRPDPKVYENVPREVMSMRTALSGIWWEDKYKNPKNI